MEKSSKSGSRLDRLAAYAGPYRWLTYAALVMSAVSAALSVVPYYYIWRILDEVLAVYPDLESASGIVHNGWMALAFTVLSIAFYIAALMCSHKAAFRISKNIKKRALDHVLGLPPGAFDMIGSGKVRRTIVDSAEATHTYAAHQLPDLAGSVVLPVAIIVMLFFFDWRLGIACIIPIAASMAIMYTMMGSKALSEFMGIYQTALGDMNREAVEYVRGVSVVKTFQQSVHTFQRFKDAIMRYGKFASEYARWCRGRMVAFVVLCNLAFAFLILAAMAINGGIEAADPGFLSDFLFYVIFSPLVAILMMRIMYSSEDGYKVDDGLDRIDELLAMEQLPEPSEPRMPEDMTVRFENVTFSYPGTAAPAVDSLCLTMRPGTVTALVGPSGSGKSTVASLASRFWDPQGGSISIGGVDLREIGSANIARLESYVFQSNSLIKGTLLDNVRLGRPDATPEQVADALREARCDDIVAKMPDGLDTVIGPGGVYLSGGETQRVAIARAILKGSPIVILDEATAFADPENEYLVQQAFERLAENRTVLIIAHRLTTVRDADCICVVDGGRIRETGTHAELMKEDGEYRRMWDDYQRSLSWRVAGVAQ